MNEAVEFASEGALLRGLLLRPNAGSDPPIVIMTHGTSATIRMVADQYAEVFRGSGLGQRDRGPDPRLRSPTHYDVSRYAYELMPDPKQWYDIAGGHFGLLYHPGPLFDEASGVQASFLERWLASD